MTSLQSSVDRLLSPAGSRVSLKDLAGVLKIDPFPRSLHQLMDRLDAAPRPLKVICVRREPVSGAGPTIFEFGVVAADVDRVEQVPADVMISRVTAGELFYIRVGDRLASLVMAKNSAGREIVQGVANGAPGDLLFSVPPCPGGQFIPPEFGDTPSDGDLNGQQPSGPTGPGDIPDPPESGDPTSHHDGGD